MDAHSSVTILILAFGLGMLHALDADHIMAVSSLSSTRPGFRQSLKFCASWAIGHGTTLLLIGSTVMGFGMAIPTQLSEMAESLVGVVLILIGVFVLWDLYRQRVHLHFHQHDNIPQHAHWHVHEHTDAHAHSHSLVSGPVHNHRRHAHPHQPHHRHSHTHQHGAVMVGVLHGAAGSAPLLALIPITQLHSVWLGLLYILLFGLGVLLAMLIFGGLLGGAFNYVMRWGKHVVNGLRISVASGAIALGVFLLVGHGALNG